MEIVYTRQKTQRESSISVFHLVNPSTTPWKSLLEPINALYNLKIVDMEQWVEELKQITAPTPDDLEDKPALKLLGFYQSLIEGQGALSVPLEKQHTKAASPTMKSLSPITPDMMETWLKQWAF